MALNVVIAKTSGPTTVEVPEEVAQVLQETYEALKELPVNNAANVDFDTAQEARLFVRQGQAWAEEKELKFQRRGNVKENPTRVTFRIYLPKPGEGRGRPKGSTNSKSSGADKATGKTSSK